LTHIKAAVDDVARLIDLTKILFIFYCRYHMILTDDKNKINDKTLQSSTLFIHLFIK